MKQKSIFGKLALVLTSLLIASCGGGGGGSNIASGGTGGTGISAGSITDFGSIFVNGVEFSTSSATIRRDDTVIAESELRRGMEVEVRGSIDSPTQGSATTVQVEEAVRGIVESKAGTATAGTIVILGQTVRIDDRTIIDNNVPDFAGIASGALLEVHGQRLANGDIVAGFIERKTAPVVYSVRGKIAGHNTIAQTFTIGALTVSYAGAITNDMPGGSWNNLFAEVKGATCAGNPVCGTLTATKVEPAGLSVATAAKAEVEGFVTELISVSDFTVNAQRVVTTGTTAFSGGLASEIATGVKLEVEGSLSGGVLTATKVRFKDNVRVESNATAAGATITAVSGLPGITVTANAFTEFKNTAASASDLSTLNGRNIRIRGRANGANSVIASEIEDRGAADPGADVILQGPASSVADPTLAILGVPVNTTNLISSSDFKGIDDAPITRSAFFGALGTGSTLVKAKGRLPTAAGSNELAASDLREIELED